MSSDSSCWSLTIVTKVFASGPELGESLAGPRPLQARATVNVLASRHACECNKIQDYSGKI